MHRRERYDVLKTLEFPRNQGSMSCTELANHHLTLVTTQDEEKATHTPRASIGYIEMIATLFRRELRARFSGDPVAEYRWQTLEFACFVLGIDPVGNFSGSFGLHEVNIIIRIFAQKETGIIPSWCVRK